MWIAKIQPTARGRSGRQQGQDSMGPARGPMGSYEALASPRYM